MARSTDWKVWKLHGRDVENLIVNTQKASKLRAIYLSLVIQTFNTGRSRKQRKFRLPFASDTNSKCFRATEGGGGGGVGG